MNTYQPSEHDHYGVFTSQAVVVGQWLIFCTMVAAMLSPPLTAVFMAVTFIWVFAFQTTRCLIFQVTHTSVGKIILLWLGWIFLTIFWADTEPRTAWQGFFNWRKLIFLWVVFALFQNNWLSFQRFYKKLLYVIGVLVIASFLVKYLTPYFFSADGSANSWGWSTFVIEPKQLGKLMQGTLVRDSIIQSVIFAMAGVMSLRLFIHTCQYRYLFGTLLVTLNLCLVTIGRSGYLFFLIAVVLYLLFEPKLAARQPLKKLMYMGLAVAILLVGFLGADNSRGRIEKAIAEYQTGIQQPENTSIGLRLTFWRETVKMVPTYLLQGAGPGSFEDAFKQNLPNAPVKTADPHNQYLRLLVEQGLLGVLFLFALLYAFIVNTHKCATRPLLGALVLALMASNVFNSHFTSFEGFFIWAIFAMIAGQKIGGNEPQSSDQTP